VQLMLRETVSHRVLFCFLQCFTSCKRERGLDLCFF
jgi:hypothetical protein